MHLVDLTLEEVADGAMEGVMAVEGSDELVLGNCRARVKALASA